MNKILFIISIFLFLSCNINLEYKPINPIDKTEKEIKEDTYKYNYRDYSKFSRELKKLAELRKPLVDKNDFLGDPKKLGSIYTSLFEKKSYYDEISFKPYSESPEEEEPSDEEIKKWVKTYYGIFREELLRVKLIIKDNKRLDRDYIHIFNFREIYYSIQFLIIIKNRLGNFNKLKEAYREFDILFLKEVLAEATKILIYYFPYHYEDLAYLFEDSDKYFK